MSGERIPVPGVTAELMAHGAYEVRGPNGKYLATRSAAELGITVPKPRVSERLGLDETVVRRIAAMKPHPAEWTDVDSVIRNAAILIAAEDVALWNEAIVRECKIWVAAVDGAS